MADTSTESKGEKSKKAAKVKENGDATSAAKIKEEKKKEKERRRTEKEAEKELEASRDKEKVKDKKKKPAKTKDPEAESVEDVIDAPLDGEVVLQPSKSKPKVKKDVEVEPAEPEGAEEGSGTSRGLFSILIPFRKKKDGKGIDKHASDLSPPPPPPLPPTQVPASPRNIQRDKEEEEAIATLLKGGDTTKAPHESQNLGAADLLRAIVDSTGVAGGMLRDATNTLLAPAPMRSSYAIIPEIPIGHIRQRTTLFTPEPISDSVAHLQPESSSAPTEPVGPPFPLLKQATNLRRSGGTQVSLNPLGNSQMTPAISPNPPPKVNDGSRPGSYLASAPTGSSAQPRLKHSVNDLTADNNQSLPSLDGTVVVVPERHSLPSSEAPPAELGEYFYSRMTGGHTDVHHLSEEHDKELARQAKTKAKKEAAKKEGETMKFSREDGRYKYKGQVVRISIADEKKDSYEIVKFSHNAWNGVRFYWVPDGYGRFATITGEERYLGYWKKGVRQGEGEGYYEMNDVEGLYSGEWKGGKPHGQGKFLTRRFTFEGGWKEGKRHGFGDYLKERLQYTGDWSDDKKQGYGIAVYADNTRYEGEWEADVRKGFGICRYPDGSIYTGDWSDNQRHGQGTSIYSNGNRYVGSWYKDMKQGKGTMYGALHQKLYEGNWWRNKRHGQGTGWFLDTGDRYEGEWFLGKQHGEGDWYGADGSSYKGSYVDGFRNGTGLVNYASGDRYVGEWVRGKREGALCAYVWKDYGKFVGPYINDRACGKGEYHTFANRKIVGVFEEAIIEDALGRYTGLTLDGKRYGRGIQVYKGGDRYDGEWRDGMRQGYGVMQYEDGGRYVGFWLKDERSKLGTFSLPNGEKYVGRWMHDKRHGLGTMIFENKDRLVDVQWSQDAPVDGPGVFVFANRSVYRGPLKDGVPHGRGSLTLLISLLLKERAVHRMKMGLHYYLRDERESSHVHVEVPELARSTAPEPDPDGGDDDITAYVDSAKKNKKKSHVDLAEFEPNTITFWREFSRGKLLDGPGLSLWDGNRYEGDFSGYERSGVGRMTRTSGESYYGQWKYDREWGIGQVVTRSQDTYLGYWHNGLRNGVGSQSYDDGGTFYGKWMNGKRHGIGIFQWPDKTYYSREYYQGELIAKRPLSDNAWVRTQLNSWSIDNFAKTLQALQNGFAEWSKGGPMPEYFGLTNSFTDLPDPLGSSTGSSK